MKKILIAGIGNIFLGDDAFGCEVVRQLQPGEFPEVVIVTDFGIRSYDLAYALTDGYDAIILVDAVPRGQAPGTLYLIEPAVNGLSALQESAVDAHSMNPVSVIQMAQSLGGVKGKLFLIGCEPAVPISEEGEMGLSRKVQEAMPEALKMIHCLVNELLNQNEKQDASQVAA
jgi:hydrogenase maturation protease